MSTKTRRTPLNPRGPTAAAHLRVLTGGLTAPAVASVSHGQTQQTMAAGAQEDCFTCEQGVCWHPQPASVCCQTRSSSPAGAVSHGVRPCHG